MPFLRFRLKFFCKDPNYATLKLWPSNMTRPKKLKQVRFQLKNPKKLKQVLFQLKNRSKSLVPGALLPFASNCSAAVRRIINFLARLPVRGCKVRNSYVEPWTRLDDLCSCYFRSFSTHWHYKNLSLCIHGRTFSRHWKQLIQASLSQLPTIWFSCESSSHSNGYMKKKCIAQLNVSKKKCEVLQTSDILDENK